MSKLASVFIDSVPDWCTHVNAPSLASIAGQIRAVKGWVCLVNKKKRAVYRRYLEEQINIDNIWVSCNFYRFLLGYLTNASMDRNRSRDGRVTDGPCSAGSRPTSLPRILLPIQEDPEPLVVSLLHALVEYEGGEALVAKIVSVPEQTPVDLTDQILGPHYETLNATLRTVAESDPDTPFDGFVRVGHKAVNNIARTADEHCISTIVTSEINGDSSLRNVFASELSRLRANTACSVVGVTPQEHPTEVSSILVPIAGGPHSKQAVVVARALAKRHEAMIDLVHVVEPNTTPEQRKEAEQCVEARSEQLSNYDKWNARILEAASVSEAIIKQSANYSVTVQGASQKARLRRFITGSKTADVRQSADSAVVTVWA